MYIYIYEWEFDIKTHISVTSWLLLLGFVTWLDKPPHHRINWLAIRTFLVGNGRDPTLPHLVLT